MNRHFHDTRYYLKRAGQSVRAGLGTELRPLRERFDGLLGREAEAEETPERGRFGAVREAAARARDRLGGARRDRQRA